MMLQDCTGFDYVDETEDDGIGWSLYWIARQMPARNIVNLALKPDEISDALVSAAEDIAALGKRAADIRNELLAYCPYFIGEHGAKVVSFLEDDTTEFDTGFHETKRMDGDEAGLRWDREPVDLLCISDRTANDGKRALVTWRRHVRAGGLIACLVGEDTFAIATDFMGNYGEDWCMEWHERVTFLWREK